MKTLQNPTDSIVRMQKNGQSYEIAPFGYLDVTDDIAEYWVLNVHKFLQILPMGYGNQNVIESPIMQEPVTELVEEMPKIKKSKK